MFRNDAVIRQVCRIAIGVLLCSALMLGVYAVLGRFHRGVLIGAVIGSVLAILNFLFLSMSVTRAADQAESAEDVTRAKLSVQLSSTVRLLALAGILFAVLKAGICAPLSTLLPLIFVRITIYFTEFFRKVNDK